ncbi:MAG: polysaccharide biosynthesis C-terminal domain-containing protein [Janthinobacterium lividum]
MNTRTILRNTAWFALENALSFGASLISSFLIARTLGPTRMGHVVYVLWVVNICGSLGGVGIPATTRKYMAEFLGGGQRAPARQVYRLTLLAQVCAATLVTGGATIWVLKDVPSDYRLASVLLVLSIWPSMVNSISAFANIASEDLSANLPASAASTVVFFVITILTVVLHWGVMGVAISMLTMRLVDFAVRFVPTFLRIHGWREADMQMPVDLWPRMRGFALQSVTSMLLTLVVWDRSEVLLLKHFSSDVRQIAFYSVAFSLAERLLVFPTVFASATGASMFAQFGRDRSRLPAMTAASARYLGLTSIPLHIIATSLAGAALLTMYGDKYAGAITVAMAAPLLCSAKAFLTPVQTMFESLERQSYFIAATLVASVIDVAVAVALIPRYGALGAAIGSGVAQMICVGALWFLAVRKYGVQLPWQFFGKVAAISTVASGVGYLCVVRTPPLVGVLLGGVLSTITFLVLADLTRIFEEEDLQRFKVLVAACPAALAAPVNLTYGWLSRRAVPVQTEELL